MFPTWLRHRGRRRSNALNYHPRLEAFEDRLLPSTYAVINTADSGQGSLRQALLDANANPGPNTIIFVISGTGTHTIQPLSPLPTITRPVTLDATYQPGYNGSPLIELDGHLAGTGANGLTIQTGSLAGNTMVKGLDITRPAGSGYAINIQSSSAPVVIQADFIGTDVTGTEALGGGMYISGNGNVTIGGTTAGAGNLIEGTIYMMLGAHAVIQGNYIGTDITGTLALGGGGVYLQGGSTATIGGTAANASNVISGGGGIAGAAIYVGYGNAVIQGNLIGTDVTGTQALGNGIGVFLTPDAFVTIGGTAAGAGNVISGNTGDGIVVECPGCTIQGNFIGTDITGTQPLGNGGRGISVLPSGLYFTGATIGGNVISANGGDGVFIGGGTPSRVTFATVRGNLIGTDVTGTQALGNGGNGIAISGAFTSTTIGGTAAGAANTIAYNGNDGVLVNTANHNSIRANSIFSNGNLGIELLNNGNDNQAAPVLTSAVSDGSSITIVGTLTAAANTTFTLDFFANDSANPSGFGEGQYYLGTMTVTTGADGTASFAFTFNVAVAAGQFVSATATAPNGDTSAFAADVVV